MARTKGSQNKEVKLPDVYTLAPNDRLEMLALLVIEIVSEELCTEN